ncbi:MAG: hypothetical protein GY927_00975, partial [bacterium]|nr:hypothetical protein [bacterium]
VGRVAQHLASLQAKGERENQVVSQLVSLASIAYTLQGGREAMEERLAVVVSSVEELVERLKQYEQKQTAREGFYQGNTKTSNLKPELLIGGEAGESFIKIVTQNRELDRLAQLWVSGVEIDWQLLYLDETPTRISLPTYPFERKRYWVGEYAKDQKEKLEPLQPPNQRQDQQNGGKLVLKPTHPIALSQVDDLAKNRPAVTKMLSETDLIPGEVIRHEKRDQPETIVSKTAGLSEFDIRHKVQDLLKSTLYLDSNVDEQKPFNELGMDSITGVEFAKTINQTFSIMMKIGKLYDYPTVKDLSDYIVSLLKEAQVEPMTNDEGQEQVNLSQIILPKLEAKQSEQSREKQLAQAAASQASKETDVAVIGMSGRFPGAATLEEYWHNLKEGICSITEIPPDRWDVTRYYDPNPANPAKSYSKWGGFLADIDKFDPLFFSISPAEAEMMDPQQRLVLEEAYHALEQAGYGQRSTARRSCGLYVGLMGGSEYLSHLTQTHLAQAMMGNAGSILAGRVAYAFDLQGPVITVDTACSSSLVAVDMACKSLINQEAELMLAGGVTLYLTEQPYLGMSKALMLSAEGLCKTFDNRADGFVPGEGVGFVVLKLLSQAIADGDTIYGVIKGSGVNQDGKTNGLTAPNVKSQRELQLAIYQKYGIDPSEISYVETHGTGTKLGDPIEVEALTESFRTHTEARQYCAVGSVKTNIGHTSAAAGVAGLIKVLLSLKHGQIPPSLHFDQENEHIGFKDTPFYVNTELKPWQPIGGRPRLAAVSSFGFSGTNAHVVIEEYASQVSGVRCQVSGEGPQLIVLSARNEERLREYVARLLAYLEQVSSLPLAEQALGGREGTLAIEQTLREMVSGIMGVAPPEIEFEQQFEGYGFDPVQLSRLKTMVEEWYHCELPITLFSRDTSVASVEQYISSFEAEGEPINQATPQLALSLVSIAYTLQVGREAMDSRLALVVSSVEELVEALRQYEQKQTAIEGLYRGNARKSTLKSELLLGGEAGDAFIRIAIRNREFDRLAQLWVTGVEIEWGLLYGEKKPGRISLPTYPFARERYWIPALKNENDRSKTVARDEPTGSRKMVLLAKEWVATQISQNKRADHQGRVAILATVKTRLLAEEL